MTEQETFDVLARSDFQVVLHAITDEAISGMAGQWSIRLDRVCRDHGWTMLSYLKEYHRRGINGDCGYDALLRIIRNLENGIPIND